MTDGIEAIKPRTRRASMAQQPPPTIPEEPSDNPTISALVNSTPLLDPNTANIAVSNITPRTRRRSSLSILQALVHSNSLLPTKNARERNFLVGSGTQLTDDVMDDVSSCFPNGRVLTIMVATWNTGEASKLYEQNYTPTARETTKPKTRMLDDMCDILLPTFIDYVSDLIIVSTQEMVFSKKIMDWEVLLQEVIGPTHVLFHSVHFGTLSLCIFLRRDLIWFCTEPEEDTIKFRAMSPLRTKGSIAVSFNLFGTSFMIINSHFEAGDDAEGRSNRRLNFQNTLTKLSIPHEFVQRTVQPNKSRTNTPEPENLKPVESSLSLDSTPSKGTDITKSCDLVLWAGDLNFRIDMPHGEVVTCCKESNYKQLLTKDEFRVLHSKTGDAYSNFKEADIDFPPTYKFDLRTDKDYAKHRTPSYTDRVLYRDKPTSPMECTQYKSVEGVKHSDHKPVVAHFRVKLKPGSNTGNLSYGKFNHEVYKRGCEQRERHHSLGVGLKTKEKRRGPTPRSSVCVLQ